MPALARTPAMNVNVSNAGQKQKYRGIPRKRPRRKTMRAVERKSPWLTCLLI